MDVKACDDCKKLNTEKPLLQLFENREHRIDVDSGRVIPAAGFLGFSIHSLERNQDKNFIQVPAIVCFDCLRKRVPALIDELLPDLSRAAVQAQQDQH